MPKINIAIIKISFSSVIISSIPINHTFIIPTTTNGIIEGYSTDGVMLFNTSFEKDTEALVVQITEYAGVLFIKVRSADGAINFSKIVISN